MEKILQELIEIVKEVAWEQATRECSGTNWGKDICIRLDNLSSDVLKLPAPPTTPQIS